MSKKTRKYFFGIFEDGPVLKIAQLINSNGTPILIDIKKTEMECSIYHEGGRGYDDQSLNGFDAGESNLTDDIESLPELNLDSQEELDSVISPHEHLLSIFPLNQGKIGLNSNDEKMAVHYLDRSVKNLTRRDLIKLDLLNNEEMRDKDVTWGIVPTAEDQTCVMIHKGENRLFSYLQKYNQIQSERKYFYSLIDNNDITLINAIRLNYELDKEEDVLVIYLGYDYKKGILMKGNEFVKGLPILTSSDSIDLEREITSRLALYQDEMEIPHIDKVIIAGEYCQDSILDAIANIFSSAEVRRFKFKDMLFSEMLGEELSEEELASYVIPILIAWKILKGKSNELIQTNFLEKRIIKSQKLVQFSWHSFLMLALLLVISYSYTIGILNEQRRLKQMEFNYLNKEIEFEKIKSEHDPGPDIQNEIARLTKRLDKMKLLYNDRAIWSEIIEILNRTIRKYPNTWLTSIQGNKDGFTIYGFSDKRSNIVKISDLFLDGTIKSVQSDTWEKRIIWNFEIQFSYLESLPIIQRWSKERQSVSKTVRNKTDKIENKDITDNKEVDNSLSDMIDPIYQKYNLITQYYYGYQHDKLIEEAGDFIKKHPANPLAVNCKYLLGEVFLRRNILDKAESLLNEVLLVESPMEPYALYKISELYKKTERPYLAIVNLNLVLRKFPKNDVIPKARQLLNELESQYE